MAIVADSSKIPAGCGVGVVREGLSIYVSLAGKSFTSKLLCSLFRDEVVRMVADEEVLLLMLVVLWQVW